MIATHRWLRLTFSVILSTFCAIGTHARAASQALNSWRLDRPYRPQRVDPRG